MYKRNLKSWLPLILLIGLFVLFFSFRLDKYLTFTSLRAHQTFLIEWTNAHYLTTVFIFMSCYILAVAVSFPGATFLTLVGGFLFGIVWGTLWVVLSATLGATILFFAVRTSIGNWLAKSSARWLERMRQGFQENAFSYLLTLRLIPLFPFWVINIVPALLGVNAKTFILATFLGIMPGSIVYVMVGHGLSHVFATNQTPHLGIIFDWQIFLPLLALAGLSLMPVGYSLLTRKRKKTINTNQIDCDLAIIGAGAGGLSVASVAAQLGLKVILIESGKMGGDCLNYGCVPSKSLLAAAKIGHQLHKAAAFGLTVQQFEFDFSKVMQHVHGVIKAIEKNDSVERFESLGVQVIKAAARFSGPNTLIAGELEIQARHVVIATGSSPLIPPIIGLEKTPFLTNETIFNLNEQPQHLIIIGGGPIGCELAQAFSMLGSAVTILEGVSLLPKDDADCVAILREQFLTMGIAIYEESKVQQVEYNVHDGFKVSFEKQGETLAIMGSHLLIATGRRANVNFLDLEKANIRYSAKGIEVNPRLQTSNKKIYAIGDVIGTYQFTHVANYHAGIVLRNILFKLPVKVHYHAVPWVTYTEPEIAHVGISAEEAFKRSDVKITQWPFSENDRAQTELSTQGKIKVFTNKKGTILGVTLIGSHAGELILPWVIAVRERRTLRHFTEVIAPYPTLSEISKRVASEFYKPTLFSNKTRWLVNWLKKLG